ncbi:hypothetical protein OG689_41650 [Kitasatospora sp. NBC_00240]|uniref:hypothetical protein n=1 Tax=Kitasatospora sp. NBC_00240 TaxID=2903567 RepID=UPI002259AE10|nr:hypothetical protein [Kitasatospora sp. NBC_00240]MCX5215663.1 hypothetical protein [Kitasatospora sp. NBC_00240]
MRTTITTGLIDSAAVEAFTRGQCHALALAMAEATGWPTGVLCQPECDAAGCEDDFCNEPLIADNVCACQLLHLVALRPDGCLVDINGVHDPDRVPGFEECPVLVTTQEVWSHILSASDWRRPALAAARTFVARCWSRWLCRMSSSPCGDSSPAHPII